MNILSSTNDQILEPASQKYIAIVIHHDSVACLEPRPPIELVERIILHNTLSRIISCNHLRARHVQLTGLTPIRYFSSIRRADSDRSAR
jgi:hypothetical protein